MTLRTKDRLILSTILPEAGNLATLRTIRKLRESLEFSAEETAALKFLVKDKQTMWDAAADKDVEIAFESDGFKLILAEFDKLDKASTLTLDQLPVYERFLAVMQNA